MPKKNMHKKIARWECELVYKFDDISPIAVAIITS